MHDLAEHGVRIQGDLSFKVSEFRVARSTTGKLTKDLNRKERKHSQTQRTRGQDRVPENPERSLTYGPGECLTLVYWANHEWCADGFVAMGGAVFQVAGAGEEGLRSGESDIERAECEAFARRATGRHAARDD